MMPVLYHHQPKQLPDQPATNARPLDLWLHTQPFCDLVLHL